MFPGSAKLPAVLPLLQPLPLTGRPEPFSHPDWLFEVKYDGFRALAHLDPSGVRLVSRNGNRFASFTDLCASLEFFLKAKSAVLDSEIVCLDENGHSQFNFAISPRHASVLRFRPAVAQWPRPARITADRPQNFIPR